MDIQEEREVCNTEFEEEWGIFCEAYGNGYDKSVAKYFFFEAWQQAKAQVVLEWISVEDQMPAKNGNYLVCIDGDVFYLTAKWVKNHFKFLARGYGLTEDFTDWRYCEGVKVTHWMPLPDSPKAQEPANVNLELAKDIRESLAARKIGGAHYIMSSEEVELAYEVFNNYIDRNSEASVGMELPFDVSLGANQ